MNNTNYMWMTIVQIIVGKFPSLNVLLLIFPLVFWLWYLLHNIQTWCVSVCMCACMCVCVRVCVRVCVWYHIHTLCSLVRAAVMGNCFSETRNSIMLFLMRNFFSCMTHSISKRIVVRVIE